MNLFRLLLPGTLPVSYIHFRDSAILPKRSTLGSAGCDIALPTDFPETVINPGESVACPLGYGIKVPRGYYVSLQTRSGLSIKSGIVLGNGTEGVIDSDYRGEIQLSLFNRSKTPFTINSSMRVAQLLYKKHYDSVVISDRLFNLFYDKRDNQRGSGGFGSTGHN